MHKETNVASHAADMAFLTGLLYGFSIGGGFAVFIRWLIWLIWG